MNYSASNSRFFRINGKFVISSTVESGNCPLFCVVSTSQWALSTTERLWDDACSVSPLPPSSWLSPTSSSSRLSFSICLSSCNISVWTFHPLSHVCPSHLVWKPPPPFLHFSISLHLEGSLFPRGSLTVSLMCPLEPFCVLLSFYCHSGCLSVGPKMIFVLWGLEWIPSTDQLSDLKENLFAPQRDRSCWGDYIWFEAVITGSFVSAHSVALASLSAFVCVNCTLGGKKQQSGL